MIRTTGLSESKFDEKWDQKIFFKWCFIVDGESVKSVEGKLIIILISCEVEVMVFTRTGKLMFDGGFVWAPRFPCRDLYILIDVEAIWCVFDRRHKKCNIQ